MTRKSIQIHAGYEVGTGNDVSIPLAHTFVTGQTQVSGKTTTLQALVARSGCRALAFDTKRGEELEGHPIRPYLPREGDEEIHWRYVETIMASALGQRALKYERLQIINATKGAYSLEDVRRNISRLQGKAKGPAGDIYTLLGEYLDLVLPEMRALKSSDTLALQPGLNVMKLTHASPEMQALIIGAAMQHINEHKKGVLTVFPEAWQFAPRDRNTAAKFQAEKMARMGAVLGNFLLTDSQDIIGVSPVLRQASTIWIIGAQREGNELKRSLSVIKSSGVAAPKPSEIGTLPVGQSYVCHGTKAIKTYIQPTWLSDEDAIDVAVGGVLPDPPAQGRPAIATGSSSQPSASNVEPKLEALDDPESEIEMSDALHKKLDRVIELTETLLTRLTNRDHSGGKSPSLTGMAVEVPVDVPTRPIDEENLYQRFKARLFEEAPKILKILGEQPELQVTVDKKTVEADGSTLLGRVAMLIARNWMDEPRTNNAIVNELGRTGGKTIAPRVSEALAKLKGMGFVTDEGGGWQAVKDMKRSIVKK